MTDASCAHSDDVSFLVFISNLIKDSPEDGSRTVNFGDKAYEKGPVKEPDQPDQSRLTSSWDQASLDFSESTRGHYSRG